MPACLSWLWITCATCSSVRLLLAKASSIDRALALRVLAHAILDPGEACLIEELFAARDRRECRAAGLYISGSVD
jgi:hypothetical protein